MDDRFNQLSMLHDHQNSSLPSSQIQLNFIRDHLKVHPLGLTLKDGAAKIRKRDGPHTETRQVCNHLSTGACHRTSEKVTLYRINDLTRDLQIFMENI